MKRPVWRRRRRPKWAGTSIEWYARFHGCRLTVEQADDIDGKDYLISVKRRGHATMFNSLVSSDLDALDTVQRTAEHFAARGEWP